MRTTTTATALTAVLLLTTTACGSSDDKPEPAPTSSSAAEPADTDQDTAEDELEQAEKDFEKAIDDLDKATGETLGVHEGTYEVTNNTPDYEDAFEALDDEYIAPGTYTTKGPPDPESGCYWARMRDASGETSAIIANDLTDGRTVVELKEGEFFKTSGCKPWTRKVD